jgi:hypothetical protein
MKIFQTGSIKQHLPRVRIYLGSFFFDVLWDDPQVFQNLCEQIANLERSNPIGARRMYFLNRIKFINNSTWNSVLQSLAYPSHREELLQSAMRLAQGNQITEDNWTEFVRVLSISDTSQFQEKLYFTRPDAQIMQFILDEICALTNINDEIYFEILESKVISALTIRIEDLPRSRYEEIRQISSSSFNASIDLNQAVLDMLNNIPISVVIMENLIKWLIQKMMNFTGLDDTIFTLMMCDNLLCLVSACVQKEDYLYRKITNSPNFNKLQMIKLLEKMVNHHPYFPARGSAFILLSAMDQSDPKVIINVMNTLMDENLVNPFRPDVAIWQH